MKISYTVDAAHDGRELRQLVRAPLGLSAKLWKHIKWNGTVLVNGKKNGDARLRVHTGDELTLLWQEVSSVVPVDLPLDILYEDETFLVVNKPADMIVHPTHRAARDTLVHAVAGYFERRGEAAGIHPLYRLDRDTTGIVILAKSARIQHAMTKHHGQIYREYLALAQGHLDCLSGRIDMPIGRDITRANHWQVRADGRRALTEYETIASWPAYSLLKIHLLTGRTHQIRVHFAALGHPLLGDTAYDGSCDTIPRQALHAWRVHFFHPDTGKEIRIEAPIPEDMCRLIGSDTVSRETFKEEIK
ncbi:RluA family pseudouridine synthase [Mitsuokella multacida]|uniref:Pseudouridine synthase n=1 Tax=Mitsuokella multacida DSM 20544 TaxID=500635 RepID=C9KQC1_9FIRM|nr:RluA family pseudouridine synthase [Mitsuokella multacida]EEX67912.1 pseudouridine synthase, RluA family [Mitsuokella multacida DSM 20544]